MQNKFKNLKKQVTAKKQYTLNTAFPYCHYEASSNRILKIHLHSHESPRRAPQRLQNQPSFDFNKKPKEIFRKKSRKSRPFRSPSSSYQSRGSLVFTSS